MIVDASTHEFLTIRQIPSMTLINTALSDDSNDLIISISGTNKEVAIPLRPSPDWLDQHTTLRQVKVWDVLTDGYVYGDAVNSLLSEFLGRDVCLVYKGPTPRGLKGNGAPEVLGREQFTNFPDLHPVQIASLASIEELNSRLVQRGDKPISVERFRPNIIVKGNAPWIEDSWKTVRISSSRDDTTGYIDFDVLARCARCQVPNVNPDSAEKHPREPWDTLVGYRRVDEGIKFKPCFGMLSAPRSEGVLETGMRFEVTKTGEHHYIKGF